MSGTNPPHHCPIHTDILCGGRREGVARICCCGGAGAAGGADGGGGGGGVVLLVVVELCCGGGATVDGESDVDVRGKPCPLLPPYFPGETPARERRRILIQLNDQTKNLV